MDSDMSTIRPAHASAAARRTGSTCRSTPMSRTSSEPVSAMPGAPSNPVPPTTSEIPNDRASMTLKLSIRCLRRSSTAAMPPAPQKGTSHWNPPMERATPKSIIKHRPSQPTIAISLSRRIQ
ncbi:hypothetical protein GCM10022419_069360 [Nonomuraea rosea]|uniref:Uncharacterized protein n=1 Tax=Nonomuraea rosea TaxID=638574 RepID=A0ABP6Y7J4_9ACTN